MMRNSLLCFLLFIGLVPFSSTQLYAQDEKNHTEIDTPEEEQFDFILRWGQGGFSDSRSPSGKLGGGQFALDIKLKTLPIALSLSSEYYTNSREPTHSYEISNLYVINILYMEQLFNFEKAKYFFGGGIGRLKVPKDEDYPNGEVESIAYNLEAGVHYMKAFWNIGFYGAAKYLRAQKGVIDFNEGIILLGVTYSFSL